MYRKKGLCWNMAMQHLLVHTKLHKLDIRKTECLHSSIKLSETVISPVIFTTIADPNISACHFTVNMKANTLLNMLNTTCDQAKTTTVSNTFCFCTNQTSDVWFSESFPGYQTILLRIQCGKGLQPERILVDTLALACYIQFRGEHCNQLWWCRLEQKGRVW